MLSKKLKDFQSKVKIDFSKVYLSLAVFWFSIRVIPKPSRAAYPCQQATLGLISVKLAIVFSTLVASTTSLFNRRSVKALSVLVLVGVVVWDPLTAAYYQYNFAVSRNQLLTIESITYGFSSNRVIRVHLNTASNWDFNSATSKYWESINQTAVDMMVERGVVELTGTLDLAAAWNNIMQGYTSGQKVGIKINGNDWWYGKQDGEEINSIPQVTNAIVKGLKSIGVPERDIYVIENTYPTATLGRRVIPPYYTNIVAGKYPNVVFVYATPTDPTYGNVEGTTVTTPMGSGRINDQVASMDHLILVPIMKAITPRWGITGAIKLMQGVIENVYDFHGTSSDGLADSSANNPNVLMYQNPHIIGKTRLIVGDGLFGAWTGVHFGETGPYAPWQDAGVATNDVPKRWLTFGDGAPNLLFFGVDPVAIDSVMLDHVNRERAQQDNLPGVSTPQLPEPQLIAGEAAGLGVREHGPPYANINYVEVELGGAPSPTHDVAITNVVPWLSAVVQGGTVNINVTVSNQGNQDETVNVSAYYNASLIQTQTGIFLDAGSSRKLLFTWNTGGVGYGKYRIRAEVSSVTGEIDLSDNSYSDGIVTVSSTAVHDIAITGVLASPVTVLPGQTVNVTVSVRNEGTQSESFTLRAYANTTLIGSKTVLLNAGDTTDEIFSWDTTEALGLYLIAANTSTVTGETDTADNSGVFDGAVAVFTHAVEFPVASFIYSPSNPTAEETIAFNAASSTDPDGNIESYIWDFGDGTTGQGVSMTHTYTIAGDYVVTLRVTDNDGLFDLETKSLLVREKPSQPLFPIEYIAILLTVAAIAAVSVAVLLLRRRTR